MKPFELDVRSRGYAFTASIHHDSKRCLQERRGRKKGGSHDTTNPASTATDLDFKDTWHFALGAQYRLKDYNKYFVLCIISLIRVRS